MHNVSLEELEVKLLSEQVSKQRRTIIVEEGVPKRELYKTLQEAIDKHYRRRIITFAIIFLALLLLVPIFFPDRYEIVKDVVSIFLAALSGFAIGKVKIFQTE